MSWRTISLSALLINNVLASLPASPDTLHRYQTAQQGDPICQQLFTLCHEGWPTRQQQVPFDLQQFWSMRGEMTVDSGLLLRGNHIVVSRQLQKETLEKIHNGHQGMRKCQQRILTAVWCSGITQQLEQMIINCPECSKLSTPLRQPLLPTPLPRYPWEKVATDLFELKGITYLLVIDYFSRYIEVQSLTSTTSASIIRSLKSIFARHGLPMTVMSDNDPQYSSQEFSSFAEEYQFEHVTSSPHYPQAIKGLLQKSTEPYLALLAYRSTPLPWCGFSPAQLFMRRNMRSIIPQVPQCFEPEWSYLPEFREKDALEKRKQRVNFDLRPDHFLHWNPNRMCGSEPMVE